MTVTIEQINQQAHEVQRRLDTISSLIKLIALSSKITELQAYKTHLEQVSREMSAESDKLSEMMSEFKEEKRKMRFAEKALLVIVLLFMLVFTVSAQDTLATNTPDAAAILPVVATVDGAVVAATLEPTPAPVSPAVTYLPTREDLLDTFMKYGLAIAITLILALTYLFRGIAIHLAQGVPQFAWEGIKSGGGSILSDLGQRVKETDTPLDDKALELFHQFYDDLVKQVDTARGKAAPMTLPFSGVPTQAEVDELRRELEAKIAANSSPPSA